MNLSVIENKNHRIIYYANFVLVQNYRNNPTFTYQKLIMQLILELFMFVCSFFVRTKTVSIVKDRP